MGYTIKYSLIHSRIIVKIDSFFLFLLFFTSQSYDISDFRDIDPVFGTLEDFDRLIAHAKELDIKIILDFVPNHSSDQHEWFKASSDPSHADHQKYKDFYVWNKGKQLENGTIVAPNNWLSVFRGSAWTWVESRKAYYYHQFLPAQPDLVSFAQVFLKEFNQY